MDVDLENQYIWGDGNLQAPVAPDYGESPSPSSSDNGEVNQASSDEDLPTVSDVPLRGQLRTATASEISSYVMEILKFGKNILIECPPGLDRRMNILQCVLDFYHFRNDNPQTSKSQEDAVKPSKIYFAAQNFKEMERILIEIKNRFETTNHLKGIRMATLGLRKSLCVNDNVTHLSEIIMEGRCQQLIQSFNQNEQRGLQGHPQGLNICPYYPNSIQNDQLFSFVEDHQIFDGALLVRDIEDFITEGRQETNRCPYMDSGLLHANANLIICPLEILISPVLRKEHNIMLKDAIVIIDDAHDIESRCLVEGSVIISSVDLTRAAGALERISRDYQQLPEQNQSAMLRGAAQLFAGLVEPLRVLAQWIRQQANEDLRPERDEILEELSQLRINESNISNICNALHRFPTEPGVSITSQQHELLSKLKKFFSVLCTVANNETNYNVKIREADAGEDEAVPVLFILCANAAMVFGHVEQPALSVILGGDCLAPMSQLKTELGVEFQEVLQVTHSPVEITSVVERYCFSCCSYGPTGVEFALGYESRGHEIRMWEIGKAILKFCQTIPNGVVVLFHSTRYFKMIMTLLRNQVADDGEQRLLDQIESAKHIINGLNVSKEAEDTEMDRYRRLSRNPGEGTQTGALLLASVRGSLWKNHNHFLKNEEVRGIIHVSIPYGAWHHDHTIVARRKYFASRAGNPHADPDPRDENMHWYESEAFRISNQSFGRCVQHDRDWGVVVVLDSRMHAKRHNFGEYLPAWVSNLNLLRRYPFDELMQNLETFVRQRLRGNDNEGNQR